MPDIGEQRIGLVGCVKQKADGPQPAATLYVDPIQRAGSLCRTVMWSLVRAVSAARPRRSDDRLAISVSPRPGKRLAQRWRSADWLTPEECRASRTCRPIHHHHRDATMEASG